MSYPPMARLGEPSDEGQQVDASPFGPRTQKDRSEEELFAPRRDPLTSLDLVFFDTTSIYFEGAGGASLGQFGKSKDRRPDRRQIIVGAVLDNNGRPICSELWPGTTTDVKTPLPVMDWARSRFGPDELRIVTDQG